MTRLRPALRAFSTLFPVFLAILLLPGCDQRDKALSAEDETNPHFHAAATQIQERNFAEAAKAYEAALRDDPGVAQAHYELGLLYSDHLNDPVSALYHFQQYLKLRSGSDLATQAQARLDNAKINFAATLPNSPIQNAEAFAKLQSDNQALSRDLEAANQKAADLAGKLANAQKELAAASPNLEQANGAAPVQATPVQDVKPSAATPAPAPAPSSPNVSAAPPAAVPPAAPGEARTYTIAAGDTLWKISKKFYPGKIKEGIAAIQAANPDALAPGKPLKIGVALHIPASANAPAPVAAPAPAPAAASPVVPASGSSGAAIP